MLGHGESRPVSCASVRGNVPWRRRPYWLSSTDRQGRTDTRTTLVDYVERMVRLTPTHHLVLWCAIDGLDLATLLFGLDAVIGSGEKFPIVPPIPVEQARQATLELL